MYYVYVIVDPIRNFPIYVGKGLKGSGRHLDHFRLSSTTNVRLYRRLRSLRDSGFEPIIQLSEDLDPESAALQRESELIARYGRSDLNAGTLYNLTNGGDGSSGAIRTEENRRGMRERWRNGIGDVVLRASTAAWSDPLKRAARIAAISEALASPSVRERRRQTMLSLFTDERRALASRRAKKAFSTPEGRANKSAATKRNWQDEVYRRRITQSVTAAKNRWWILVGDLRFGSASEAAEYLKVSRVTVSSRCRQGLYSRVLKILDDPPRDEVGQSQVVGTSG